MKHGVQHNMLNGVQHAHFNKYLTRALCSNLVCSQGSVFREVQVHRDQCSEKCRFTGISVQRKGRITGISVQRNVGSQGSVFREKAGSQGSVFREM